ncbi:MULTISPECIES: type I-E CRISPR-associated protein Cas5/CasD [unclassified Streptomyces]|uniref:type I-E CRISPR-associated protein Cas5/CasD n=1 Tax=unclassified Streptomyces TaxID=2593676 RepID=UPI0022588062|nr:MULTISPECIES: type I-E CRISPR-associated protein Cas5/CasD [unclassified Streptomyces]MCX4650285.1 type I-E CRISPR-associated protein Cas5/CasD [Streptomyces sp. NBC_01446]MCX5321594.1 type I-E CRISPR-associated protein Cas5/CasD [Streptomyces sp. NBC_00120]MCX5323868.1 type I-E CRISPR-associated protein Cas5/CasD [Streptomyces sp. NBC_00120]MCX5327718.1 type I-E CRISPR-associated protein Cas5/CasD [Streptomyces sp. NBC_00120]
MSGLILRLSGVLQAWGERGTFHHRDTGPFPTRSALIGMIAAAQGRPRTQALAPYPHLPGNPNHHDLTFTLRIDDPGTRYRDFHTVGGGYPPGKRLPTASGRPRKQEESTLVSHRDYLIGACFTAAVQGPTALLDDIAEALTTPQFGLYLGRRSCLPDEPLLLSADSTDPVTELRTRVPLTRTTPPTPTDTTLPTTFVWEAPPPGAHATYPDREATSEPADFTPHTRSHLPRPLWLTTEHLPAALHAGPRPIDALTTYLTGAPPCTPPPSPNS